jgi:hypothetical protein
VILQAGPDFRQGVERLEEASAGGARIDGFVEPSADVERQTGDFTETGGCGVHALYYLMHSPFLITTHATHATHAHNIFQKRAKDCW